MTSTPFPRSLMQRAAACSPIRGSATAWRCGAITALLVAATSGTAIAQSTGVGPAPSPIEQALMEYGCRAPGQAMPAQAVYELCLNAQLEALRTDFGRDLQKLSAAERKTIDRTCSAVRTARGRDAYVGCMSQALAAVRAKHAGPSASPAVAEATMPTEPVPTPIEQAAAMLASSTEPPVASASTPVWLFVLLAAAATGGGAWYAVSLRRARPAVHLCRVCGGDAGATGDMCPACRHEAAESQRRAQAERAQQLRAVADDARKALEEVEPPAGEAPTAAATAAATPAATPAVPPVSEPVAQAEVVPADDPARQREADLKRWQEEAVAAIAGPVEGEFDPHAVLGISKTASEAEIRAAYDEGRAKYAAEQVAHLGIELQDHYRRKADAVERAFEMLHAPARV